MLGTSISHGGVECEGKHAVVYVNFPQGHWSSCTELHEVWANTSVLTRQLQATARTHHVSLDSWLLCEEH